MNGSKVLVATDFSASSDKALEAAGGIAKMMGATMLLVHVDASLSPERGEGMLHAGAGESLTDVGVSLEQRLQEIAPSIEGVEVEHRLLKGEPAPSILELAKSEEVAMIVLGTHGRTGLSRLLMGSVAEDIARGATCPVMLVKVPAE